MRLGVPIDPLASETELVLDWLDRMRHTTNPLVERLTFFWSKHWTISLDDGVTLTFAHQYGKLLHRFADLATYPDASFRELAYLVGESPAMLKYLDGESNIVGRPNENYGREFMELFCLGVTDPQGVPNYSERDVGELARAFSGWRIDLTDPATPVGRFDPTRFDAGVKEILGQSGAFDLRTATDVVLARPIHADFIVRQLWSEFIFQPPAEETVAKLAATYTAGGRLLIRPLVRAILLRPEIFESIGEPNMIKPPVVYGLGVVKATRASLLDVWQTVGLRRMGQLPFNPPNVAGWEGGASWLTTTSAQARFDFAIRCLHVAPAPPDEAGETAAAAFRRAHTGLGRPWLAEGSKAILRAAAAQMAGGTPAQRLGRQYALRALILGGPDGQVM